MGTTINLDPAIRDRLKQYGHAGMTYNDILQRLMDEIDRKAFLDEMRRLLSETKTTDWVDLEDLDEDFQPKAPTQRGRRARKAAAPSKARGASGAAARRG